jgi:hypothetical protein
MKMQGDREGGQGRRVEQHQRAIGRLQLKWVP